MCLACHGADDPTEDLEFDIVVGAMAWFDQAYPQYALLRWHSAMGARMYRKEMEKLKKMGAVVGQPDWTLMVPSHDLWWLTLSIEFKRPGNNPSRYPQQVAVGEALKRIRQQYIVVFSIEQFKRAVTNHLHPPPPLAAPQIDLTHGQLSIASNDEYISISSSDEDKTTTQNN